MNFFRRLSSLPAPLRKRVQRGLAWTLGVVALLLLVIALAPRLLQSRIESELEQRLGRRISLGSIAVNPLTLTAELGPMRLMSADGAQAQLSWQSLKVVLGASSLLGTPHVQQVELLAPNLRLTRQTDGSLDLDDVLARLNQGPKSTEPARFQLDALSIRDGQIAWRDEVAQASDELTELSVHLEQLQSPVRTDTPTASFDLTAKLHEAQIRSQGSLRLTEPMPQVLAQLDVRALSLAAYRPYFTQIFRHAGIGLAPPEGQLQVALTVDTRAWQQTPDVRLTVNELKLSQLRLPSNTGAPALSLESLVLEGADLAWPEQAVSVKKLELEQPEIDLAFNEQGQLLTPAVSARTAPAKAESEAVSANSASSEPRSPWKLAVAEFALSSGRIAAQLPQLARTQPFALDQIQLRIHNLQAQLGDQGAAVDSQGELSAQVDGSAFKAAVNTQAQAAQAQLALQGLDLMRYQRLLPLSTQWASGQIQADAAVKFDWGDGRWSVSQMNLLASSLKLLDPQTRRPALDVPKLAVQNAQVDGSSRQVRVQNFALEGAGVVLQRLADGQLQWQHWLTAPSAGVAKPKATASSASSDKPWSVALDQLAVQKLSVDWQDLQSGLNLPKLLIALKASQLSQDLQRAFPFELNVKTADQGALQVRGTTVASPLKLDAELDVKNLPLQHVQPYLNSILNVSLDRGRLFTQGKVQLTSNAQGFEQARYDGFVSLHDFLLTDRINNAEFLRWNALVSPSVQVQWHGSDPAKRAITFGDTALVDYYARIILNADGKLNLSNLLLANDRKAPSSITTPQAEATSARASTATSPAATETPVPVVRLGTFRTAQGSVNFTDWFVRPNYSVNLTQVTGSVSPMASDNVTPAQVDLKAKVDDDAPVSVGGTVHPLQPETYIDLKASAKGIELTNLSPYATRYTGYPIEKGKLSADVHYRVAQAKLDASNRIVLDQLVFGPEVTDPSIKKLPVQLAVALLKDSRGVIDIELPISGSLSDPSFSVGGLIGQVFMNLITKAVTAPFRLLSGLIGGGEELDLGQITFAVGRADLDNEALQRLGQLGKALQDRPGLKLEMTGHVDPDSDRAGLKRVQLDAMLRAEKVRQIKAEDARLELPADWKLTAEETPVLLAAVFDRAKTVTKPRNVLGLAKSLPSDEMQRLLLDSIVIGEQDLRELAQARVAAAREYLRDQSQIDPARLFSLAPHLEAPTANEASAPRRVAFQLR